MFGMLAFVVTFVSTHSRLKAAGLIHYWDKYSYQSFNTQPPKGGWEEAERIQGGSREFQHTAA